MGVPSPVVPLAVVLACFGTTLEALRAQGCARGAYLTLNRHGECVHIEWKRPGDLEISTDAGGKLRFGYAREAGLLRLPQGCRTLEGLRETIETFALRHEGAGITADPLVEHMACLQPEALGAYTPLLAVA
ncbi:MAG: hypothetical protein JKP92_05930 [Alphaproteobacteria bacterium]|jgi:hypothetical protein|nr:hypothetical protein [Alphaproteobacteria bacterium]